jgi:hypothetical protein
VAVRDRIPLLRRRDNPGTPPAHPRSPWWARAFVRTGQPLAVVVVMAMCAPGEHHLARLAGWDNHLAWGMAALLAGYAGMAAFLAGERRTGTPGHWTAVIGAGLALALAMAAQPVSHMFVTGWLSAEPRTPLWLVIVVSCVPAPVLGHILHLAAVPVVAAARAQGEQPVVQAEPVTEQPPVAVTLTKAPAEPREQPAESPRFLTTREVAERYGVSMSAVGNWKTRGKIRPALVDPAMGNLYDPEHLPPLSVTA